MRNIAAVLVLCLGLATGAWGEDFFRQNMIDPKDGQFDLSRYLSEVPLGFLPVPMIITEPAVGYGLAMGAVFFQESAAQRKQRLEHGALLPENVSIVGGGGTENGTWAAGLGHLGFWRKDTIRYRGGLLYGSINLDFYSLPGIGDLPRPIELNLEGPFVLQELTFRIPGTRFFAGARQLFREVDTSFANSPNLSSLPPDVVNYFNKNLDKGVVTSGLGAIAEYDTRDNPFNPQRGYYYSGYYTVFADAIGSDVDYESYNLTALNYWELGSRFNLGLRLQFDGVSANNDTRLPAYVPPYIQLRGVSASEYQGNRVLVGEVELDYKLNERWKVGIFSGLGRAADNFNDLADAKDVDSYGTGFRYLIARRYGFVMGVDVARGPGQTAFYIQAGSTWR
ncbi:MAG: BamA/TamA family outer membrane protein [Halieaceae bacterium]|nr:BamA/TamA family outer membrane protein [Halieaceae bacterium]